MYWSEATRFATVTDVMTNKRFSKLGCQFHVNDNTNMTPVRDPSHDRLFKVCPFLTSTLQNTPKIEPEEFNAVDKMIMPFKGHSSLKKYIKNKPHKWGIKVFARAGASGFVYGFDAYVAKKTIS